MRILWIKANKILPVHSGGDIRSFNILRHLSSRNEVVFCSYYDGPPDDHYAEELRQFLPNAVAISTGRRKPGVVSRTVAYCAALHRSEPFAISRFSSRSVKDWISKRCCETEPDVIVCDFLNAAINIPRSRVIPAVLFQHNVESELWKRRALLESHPFRRFFYRIEYSKMAAYERRTLAAFEHIIAVSEHDKQLMSEWLNPSRITVVPTGVDLREYTPSTRDPQTRSVVFVGAMDWEPNIDAVEFFATKIWPAVVAEIPTALFRIVGRNPAPRVAKLKSNSIEVTGRVSSTAEYLQNASIVVVPLRIGGGTRLKIYEAMACAKAIVSTSVGAEGLAVESGRNIVIADTPDIFAKAVIRLLQSPAIREKIASAAVELARSFDWSVVASKFERSLEQTVKEFGRSRSNASN